MAFRKILVPVDFSETSFRALETAAELARGLGCSLVVLHIWTPPRYFSAELTAAMPGFDMASVEAHARGAAAEDLEKFLSAFDKGSLQVEVKIEVGRAAPTILREAESTDFIVMGTHGEGRVGQLLFGSVAHAVVTRASCPVMTVRSPERRRSDRSSPR
jgi:nucleotide-binding universal stress UspA family protein